MKPEHLFHRTKAGPLNFSLYWTRSGSKTSVHGTVWSRNIPVWNQCMSHTEPSGRAPKHVRRVQDGQIHSRHLCVAEHCSI